MDNLNNKKILMVRLSSIGDTVHSIPVACAIKNAFPDAQIHWLVEPESAFLLKNNKIIDKIFIFNKKEFKKSGLSINIIKQIKDLSLLLRNEKYDLAIDVQGLLKSALLTWASGAKRKIGFKNTRELAHIFMDEKVDAGNLFDPDEHVIIKNLKLAEHLGITNLDINYSLPEIPEESKNKIDSLLKDTNKSLPNVVLLPATLWKSKHWKEEYWQELVAYLAERANVIISGTIKDKELISKIKENTTKNIYDISGETELIDLIPLFNRSDLVIGVDTGPIHIAAAVQKPKIITIMGPTSTKRTGVIGQINLCANLECIPCNKKTCPLEGDKYMRCMEMLTPEIVIEAIEEQKAITIVG